MAKQDELEALVAEFVERLRGLIRQQALEAVHESLSSGVRISTRTKKPTSGNGKRTKRDPGALDALQATVEAFIAKHPGLRIEQINKQLGTTTKELALPMRKLIAEKAIRTEGNKRSTTYFAGTKAKGTK